MATERCRYTNVAHAESFGVCALQSWRVDWIGYSPRKADRPRRPSRNYNLGFLEHGTGEVQFESPGIERIEVNGPGLILCPPGFAVTAGPAPGEKWVYRYLLMSGARLEEWMRIGWLPARPVWRPLRQGRRLTAFRRSHDRLLKAVVRGQSRALDRAKLEFERMLCELELGEPAAIDQHDRRLEKLVGEWRADPAQSVDLPRVASNYGWSYSVFRKRFHAQYGRAPFAMLTRLRMERAAHLLVNSDLLVKEIADACGYPHTQSFIRTFRRVIGRRPRQYRKESGVL